MARSKEIVKSITIPDGSWLTIILAVVALLQFFLYEPLNFSHGRVHVLATWLDRLIPLVPIFVLPYLSLYLFLIATILILLSEPDRSQLRQYLLATIFTLTVAYTFYGFYQTQVIRPAIVGHGYLSHLVAFVYASDNPFNDFPSLHAALSFLSALFLYRPKLSRVVLMVWGSLIAVSTIFVKQHYVVDVLSGLALAVCSYYLSRLALP